MHYQEDGLVGVTGSTELRLGVLLVFDETLGGQLDIPRFVNAVNIAERGLFKR